MRTDSMRTDISVGDMLREIVQQDEVWSRIPGQEGKFSNTPTTFNLMLYALALGGEVGEFENVVKKLIRDGGADYRQHEFRAQLLEELVDIQIYIGKLLLVLQCSAKEYTEAWDAKRVVLRERWGEIPSCG